MAKQGADGPLQDKKQRSFAGQEERQSFEHSCGNHWSSECVEQQVILDGIALLRSLHPARHQSIYVLLSDTIKNVKLIHSRPTRLVDPSNLPSLNPRAASSFITHQTP